MVTRVLVAAAALLLAAPAIAEDAPDDNARAVAAGYKALNLCSAIGNAEWAGASRDVASVTRWELTGVYPDIDDIVSDLPHRIARDAEGTLLSVSVQWNEDLPDRIATHEEGRGCTIHPIGTVGIAPDPGEEEAAFLPPPESPRAAGLTSPAVARAMQGDYGEDTRTTAVVVMRDGEITEESYARDFDPQTPQRTWSVAKSIAAILAGTAVEAGAIDPDGPLTDIWPEPGGPDMPVTLDTLLRMASGRVDDEPVGRSDAVYFLGETVDDAARGMELSHPPGTQFRYANNDTLMAVYAIREHLAAHPPANFFNRIGMTRTIAETDVAGNYVLSSQVWSTARDLARFGQFVLDGGVADGERLVASDWIARLATPRGPQPEAISGSMGYGAGFWLLSGDGIPSDTIAAIGNRGQYVVIIPAAGMVIVRRGEDPSGSRFDVAAFIRDVLSDYAARQGP